MELLATEDRVHRTEGLDGQFAVDLVHEDQGREFRCLIDNPGSVAGEIVAFANFDGGTLYVGVDDDGSPVGVDDADRAFQTLVNICRDRCIPPVSPTIETRTVMGKQILVLSVAPGLNRRFDRSCY